MCGCQSFGKLKGKGQESCERKGLAGTEDLAQAAPLNEFHREEQLVVGFVDRVQVNNIRVVQRSGRFGLPLKARAEIGRLRDSRAEELDRDAALEPGVFGDINHSHAATAQLLPNDVMTEMRTSQLLSPVDMK